MTRTLHIANLSVSTGGREPTQILSGLDVTVASGRVLALVGASGSGKSTACAAALGIAAGNLNVSGQVYLDGTPVAPASLRGRRVASILQNPRSGFNPLRSMRDHLRETMVALEKDWDEAAAREVLEDVGLEDPARILDLHAFEMSGGMLQRMAIAIALLSRAEFLFADEPTTDLDLVVQARILDLLAEMRDRRGLGLLLITHDMGVVARLADEVAVLDAGRLVEQGPVGQIFHAPRHPVTRMLISAHLALYGLELSA
ncbi:nickel transport system ATP-binding protein [Salipiger thiooxidans]|uniref:Nickel transport system ATP-binding protein n=1 Tax=Salipiger thiooxidans TaxID=282683 RepID=A0A1G7LQM2_9RHOB|nr:ATP-binding cassette domain-containing protein [Salipiger thiooxidans]SDF51696.1 nickel transport system ATP-binding protein [Salipiger thiooxidans]